VERRFPVLIVVWPPVVSGAHEIIGGKREHEAETRCSAVPCLAQDRHCLDVAKAFFDALADALTDRVTGMACGAAGDRRLACFADLGEMRIDGDCPWPGLLKNSLVVPKIRAHCVSGG
jgi:hypothetical protein